MQPEEIGQYKIIEKIEVGGESILYKVTNPSNENSFLTLKRLHPYLTDDINIVSNFLTGARKAMLFAGYQGIVNIMDIDMDIRDETPFIVMEYLDGYTLKKFVSKVCNIYKNNNDYENIILNIICQVSITIEIIHNENIIHSDLNLHNIMICRDGRVAIVDFSCTAGCSQEGSQTPAGTLIGTLEYKSPESLTNDSLSKSDDIWSIGVIFYELLTLVSPFKKESQFSTIQSIKEVQYIPPEKINCKITEFSKNIIRDILKKDYSSRLKTGGDIVDRIIKHLKDNTFVLEKNYLYNFIKNLE